MGIFTYTDPQTQRVYRFEHPGEVPEEEDFAFMRNYLAQERANYAEKYEQVYGEAPTFDDGTALSRGFARGTQDLSGGIGELLQTLGQRTGWEGLANYGADWEREAAQKAGILSLEQPDPMSWRDVRGLGSGLTYVGELLGSSAPVMGLGAAGATAAALTAPVSVPTLIAGGLGATLATAPYYIGSILQGQERESGEDNVNLGTAALGGTVAAALDSASLILLGKIGLSAPILKSMSGEVGQNLTGRILTGTGAGAVTEGTTEALQEVTQMLAEGVDPASPQVQERLLDAFIGGGVLGGVLGGAGRGTFGKRPEAPPATGATPPAATPPAATPPAAPGSTFAFDDAGQGQLFSDLAEGRAPAPATEIPPNLRRPDTSGLPLFDAADTNNRPAKVVLDELGVAAPAPIRRRVANTVERDPQFLAELSRYAALPGVPKELRTRIKDYVAARAPKEAASAEAAAKAATTMAQTTRATAATKAAKAAEAKAKAQAAASQTAAADAGVDETLLTETQRAARDAAAAKEAAARDEAAKAEQDAATAKAAAMKAQLDAIAPKPPMPKTEAAPASPGLQIQGVDEAVASGVSKVKVIENGKEVPFKNFALSVDGNTAEVGFVERDKSARKGVGYDAYVALGEDLAARGITLQSTETLQAPGRALWEKLAKQGKAAFDPATKRFKFAATPEATTRTAADGSTIIALPLPDGTQADVVMHDITSTVEKAAGVTRTPRAIAMREINGVKVPFYLSTGEGGKTDVPSGKWYPFFGLSRAGWFNKSSGRTITEYYFTPELRAAAEALDASVGDIRGSTTTPTVMRGNDTAFIAFINQDLNPAEPNTEAAKTNIVETIRRIKQGAALAPAATAEFNRNAAPGAVSGAAGQAIPQPGIRPAPGRQLETQAAAQRESVARQLSVKQKLDTQIANLESRIGTGPRLPDSLRAEAKQLGISAKNHKASLQAELRRLRGQRFAVTSYLNSEAGRAQAAGETIANQEAMVRRAENDAARAAYRAWYEDNTPTEIQAYDADVRGEGLKVAPVIMPETGVAVAVDPKARAQVLAREAAQTDSLDPTTVEDKAKLLELLKKGARRLAGPANENARAALAYFSKTRDIADALDNIAADAAMPDIPGKRVSTKREALHPYWKGTGQDAAKKAAQWVEDNLSDGAVDYMDEQIGRYVEDTAEAAGAVIDRQIKNTRANAEADEKTLGAYYKAMGAIDSADISAELGVESGIFDRESLRRMDARNLGADRAALDEIGIDIGGFLRNKPRSIAFGLEAPLHPAILKALRNGNLRRALEVLSATSTDPYISELAGKLVAFVGDTKVFTTGHPDADFVARITDLLTHAETGKRYPGTYVLMDRADFDRVAANNPAYAAAIQNSVLLDEASGINAHTILHEVLHPATLKEITERPDGPVARRLEELRQQVFDTVGKEYEARGEEIPYGLTSLREFVTEALSNQEFQGLLDRLYPTTKKVTALEQMLRAITNFVRTRILGKPAKVYNDTVMITSRMVPDNASVFDEVDRLTRSIFNTAPEFNVYGPLYSTAQRPADARAALDNMLLRRRPFGLADALKTKTAIDKAATGAVKVEEWTLPTILNLFTPTRNLVDLAAKYFPDAERVYDNLTKNKEYAQELSKEMWNTLKQSYKWLDKHPQLEQAFHSLRTRASKQEIDPRLPEKFYNSFIVRYYKYNADGSIGKPEYEEFSSASDARDFITKINAAEAKGAATTKAKLLFTPDKDNAALHRKLKAELDRLEAQAPGAKAAYTDYLNIAERLHREAGKALKQRIEARYPGNENAYTRNTLLRDQYNKIFADRGLLAYQPLQRTGGYRISYSGVHPDTNTVEPFVHYFASIEDAMKAKEALLALPPEYKIREANTVKGVVGAGIEVVPRGLDSPYGNRQPVPSTYVSDVVRTIRASAIKDAEAARQAALKAGKPRAEADAEYKRVFDILNANAEANAEEIVELALNALPESSIFSAYRARTGVSGFIGDLSPLKAAYDQFENDFDTPDVSRGLFENFVDSMTQKVVAIQHQADADLVRQYLNDRLKTLGQDVGNRKITERQYNNAVQYHKALTTALNNPTIRRLEMTNALNTGAYIFTLLGNASSAVMNLTGALFFVYPRLAMQYGATRAAKMMLRSLRTIANSGRMRLEPIVGPDGTTKLEPVDAGIFGRSIRNYQFSGVDHSQGFNKGNNKTNALEYLVREGSRRHLLIDSLIYDYLDGNKTRFNALNKILHWGSMPLHHVERVVRESAMVATYELELRRIADAKKSDVLTREEMEGAARTAVREAELMTGTIPSTGAPNWAQKGLMPSIAMYKRYPLAMMHLIIRDLARGMPSKATLVKMHGEGTEALTNALMERKIARLQSAAVLGTMALFAGAMGMPFYGMISDLWNLFFTDYDEEDFDTLVRMGIGELGSKGLLNYLFGVEFSSRIGLGDMLYRSPLRAEDQPPIWNILEGIGGPAVSLLHGWSTRSWDLYQQGEYYRALESAAPASIRSIMRAGRFVADGGAESLRGDIISEVSPGQAIAQALGFAPSAYIRQVELNSAAKRLETGIAQRKQNILRKLNLARRNGDSDAYNAALEEKDEFNARHPDDQITPTTIRKSRKTFQRTSEKVRNGVVFSDPQNYSLQEIMTLMDEPATFWDE